MLEKKIASVLISQIVNRDVSDKEQEDSDVHPIAAKTVYFQLINNNVLSIKDLKKKDFLIIGTALNNNTISLKNLEKSEKYALVFGNEGTGVSDGVLNLCDKVVKIDIKDSVESLNVSIAAAIMMYYMEG